MATRAELIAQLNELLRLDHDAMGAYQQAIDRLTSAYCRERLLEFRGHHRRHITHLRSCILHYGGTPEDHTDVKGFFIKGMTARPSTASDELALEAMRTNEILTGQKYAAVLSDRTLPDEVREVLARHRADETRHLEWITHALWNGIWEMARPTV